MSAGIVTRIASRRMIITRFNFARRRGYLPRDRETEARWLEKPRLKSKPIRVIAIGTSMPGVVVAVVAVLKFLGKI